MLNHGPQYLGARGSKAYEFQEVRACVEAAKTGKNLAGGTPYKKSLHLGPKIGKYYLHWAIWIPCVGEQYTERQWEQEREEGTQFLFAKLPTFTNNKDHKEVGAKQLGETYLLGT